MMSEDSDREMTEREESSVQSNSASPTSSSPIEIRSKKRKAPNDLGPSILPFSDGTERGDTARDQLIEDEPIIRGSQETQDLQVRLFQLKIDMKTIQDELRKRIPGFEDHQSSDEEHFSTQDPPSSGISFEEPSPDRTGQQVNTLVSNIEAEKENLLSQNAYLREQLRKSLDSEDSLKTRVTSKQAELDELRKLYSEKDLLLQRVQDSKEIQDRALIAEKSRSSLLYEAKNKHVQEIEILRERLQQAPLSENAGSSLKIEDLQRELDQAYFEQSQVRDMLVDERSITAELQQNLSILEKETSSRESEMKTSVVTLNGKIEDAQLQREELLSQLKDLHEKLNSAQETVENLKATNKGLEQRIDQQLSEQRDAKSTISLKDKRLVERSQQLSEKDEKLAQLGSTVESRDREIQTLTLQLKHLNVAYESSQTELNEARDTLDIKDSRLKKLKSELKEKKKEFDTIKDELNQTKNNLSRLNDNTQNEILSLQSELGSAEKEIENLKTQYQITIDDITRSHALELSHQSKDNKTKIDDLRETISRHLLQIADMKRDAYEAHSLNQQLTSETKSSRLKIESQARRISELESSLDKSESDHYDLSNKVREASEAVKAKTFELQNKFQIEEALSDKVQKLEKTISDLSVELNNRTNANINDLRLKADENTTAANDLAQLRREYGAQYAEWFSYHNNTEHHIANLQESIRNLELQISSLRASENEREANFREAVRSGHETQMERLREEYTYNYNVLQSAYESIAKDLSSIRGEKDAAIRSLHECETRIAQYSIDTDEYKRDLQISETRRSQTEKRLHEYTESEALINRKVEELQHSLRIATENLGSREKAMSILNAELEDSRSVLEAQKFNLEDAEQKSIKLQNYYSTLSVHANNLIRFAKHSASNLHFETVVYKSIFPRLDIVPVISEKKQSPIESLRASILTVLATVKFKNAARLGIKRQCYLSEKFFREHYSD